MALDSFVKSDVEGTITLSDGTGTPVTMVLAFDQGDLSITGLKQTLNETEKYERRGRLKSVGPGSRIYPSLSFSAMVHQFTDATASVLSDFVLKANKYSGNVSTLGTSHPVYALKVTFDLEGTDFGGADSQVILDDVVMTMDFAEGRPSSFSIAGEVLGAVTGDLAASEIS
jgi:hypothetical protein